MVVDKFPQTNTVKLMHEFFFSFNVKHVILAMHYIFYL